MKTVPLRRLLQPSDVSNRPDLQVLSVYRDHGVVPKASRTDNFNKTPEDVTRYLHVRAGDLVVNKMKAWSGSVGVSRFEGIVSGDYLVCSVAPEVQSRYLHFVLRSSKLVAEMRMRSVGIRPNQERLYWEDLADIAISVPAGDDQLRIAEFLDDRVARIDRMIAARREQLTALDADETSSSFETVRGAAFEGGRRASGLRWLGDVPSKWPVLTVQSQFSVELGKMLDEKRQTNESPLPYLRNTNVQWDRVDVDDLKVMDIAIDERPRYTVMAGDLLICEGGQPGRAAIWDGRIQEVGFQKALHRARTRGRSRPAWLIECLRVAVKTNAFAAENGVTTIGHLTNEQLRRQRFPFPEPDVQDHLLAQLKTQADARARGDGSFTHSIHLLTEFKASLITAAVSGELDVTTAGSGVPA